MYSVAQYGSWDCFASCDGKGCVGKITDGPSLVRLAAVTGQAICEASASSSCSTRFRMVFVKIGKPSRVASLLAKGIVAVAVVKSFARRRCGFGLGRGNLSLDILGLQKQIPDGIDALGSCKIHGGIGSSTFQTLSNVLNLEGFALLIGIPGGTSFYTRIRRTRFDFYYLDALIETNSSLSVFLAGRCRCHVDY